jgi:hypothetical protein
VSEDSLFAEQRNRLRTEKESHQTNDGERGRGGGSLSVDDNGGRSPVKSGVGQIDVRQDYDQQHEKEHAEEDAEVRRFEVPPRQDVVVLPEFRLNVNPTKGLPVARREPSQ